MFFQIFTFVEMVLLARQEVLLNFYLSDSSLLKQDRPNYGVPQSSLFGPIFVSFHMISLEH